MKLTTSSVVNFQWERAVRLWRDGSYDEARQILRTVLADRSSLAPDDELIMRKDLALVEMSASRLDEALQIMLEASPLADLTKDDGLKGRYHNMLAMIYQERREYDNAFQEYTAAAVYHERAGNWKYCGDIENNLGSVLVEAGNPDDAHPHLTRAERIFTALKEHASIAQVYDTRARAYLKQGAIDDALSLALRSVESLLLADEPRLLSLSLETLSLVCQAKRVHDALIHSDGCITGAARALGIKHNTSLNYILDNKFPQLRHLRKPKTHSRRKKS